MKKMQKNGIYLQNHQKILKLEYVFLNAKILSSQILKERQMHILEDFLIQMMMFKRQTLILDVLMGNLISNIGLFIKLKYLTKMDMYFLSKVMTEIF
jgi:hypothetical protein